MTMVVGVVLIGLGLLAVHFGGHGHAAMLGGALLICGLVASTENVKQRMIAMHIAVALGLFGALFPGITGIRDLVRAHAGVAIVHPAEVHLRLLTAAVCLVFVVLCVRSFIAARRLRQA
jgi:hypothetical protein